MQIYRKNAYGLLFFLPFFRGFLSYRGLRLADLSVARDDILVGRELGQSHRAAGVEFLREGGRDVDVDAGGVDAARELRGGLLVFGDDGLAVARRVAGDMRQCPVERRDGLDGQFVVEELGAEMLFGGMFQQPGGVVPVEGGESLFVGVEGR